ncbi:cell wall-active antibiotics response protein LiaF [Geomicrobium sp. JCM 19037]|uniref:cell wall-active antibiotics response protein LiaF n=2 Tax=unclassified Geomicrobium TaxID=2628951 RepID=UPI0009DF52A9|nr:cell wall-active antibiotics response protein LiaF [Geomicrobium sp. JCM 19037]
MMSSSNNPLLAYILFGLIILILLELIFRFQPIFFLIGAILLVYFGLSSKRIRHGKWLVLLGLIIAALSVFSSYVFRIAIFLIAIYLLYAFWKSRAGNKNVQVTLDTEGDIADARRQPYFQTMLVGSQQINEENFHSEDINILLGLGETTIHFENTVLPSGDTVVIVRGFIGKVTVYLPYDVGVMVHHSSFFGETRLLEHFETGFNQSVTKHSKQYESNTRRVRIYTSLVAGDVEVRQR